MRCGLPFNGKQVNRVCHFISPLSLARSSPQPSATSESERLQPETGPGRDRPAHCQETQRAVLCLSVGQCLSNNSLYRRSGHRFPRRRSELTSIIVLLAGGRLHRRRFTVVSPLTFWAAESCSRETEITFSSTSP